MSAYNYIQHKVSTIQDVDVLEELVVQHGNFTSKDFNYFWRQALESETPSRIKNRLNRKLKPLITKVEDNKKSMPKKTQTSPIPIQAIAEKLKPDIFGKTYHASDFSFDDGMIILGDWKLRSKRIKKVHPSWLELIDHEFKIACESKKTQIIPLCSLYRFILHFELLLSAKVFLSD